MSVVRFENVGKVYRRGRERTNIRAAIPGRLGLTTADEAGVHVALEDLSFSLEPGGTLGLIGPNGAGKSTTLKLVAGVIAPTSGTVEVAGRTASLIELGAGFHPDLTGRENLYFSAAVLGMSPRTVDQRFDQIVDFADIGQFLDTPVKRYSSGMMARLGFAVATHLDAEVLVLDEVLAVGDARFQRKCHERIAELCNNGVALLYVTHALWTVPMLCESAILLHQGRTLRRGEPVDVIRFYENIDRTGLPMLPNDSHEVSGRFSRTVISEIRVIPDQSLAFELDISVEQPMPDGTILIMITDAYRKVYATVSSREGGVDLASVGEQKLTCHLSRLPLQPGSYTIYVALFPDASLPVVDDMREFEVEVEGVEPDPAYGVVRISTVWKSSASG